MQTCKAFLAAKQANREKESANLALDDECEYLDSDNESFDELGF